MFRRIERRASHNDSRKTQKRRQVPASASQSVSVHVNFGRNFHTYRGHVAFRFAGTVSTIRERLSTGDDHMSGYGNRVRMIRYSTSDSERHITSYDAIVMRDVFCTWH